MNEWRKWFDNRLDNAIEAADIEFEAQLEGNESRQQFPIFLIFLNIAAAQLQE